MSEAETIELDDEAKRLKLEQIKSGARKDIAENQKAILAALLPTPEVKPLEGKTDVDAGVGLVGKLLAHELLQDGACTIVDGAKDKLTDPSTNLLIVEDRALVATDWTYSMIRGELQAHKEALVAAIEAFEPPTPAKSAPGSSTQQAPTTATTGPQQPKSLINPAMLSVIPAAVGAAAGLIGMFRSNYSITGKEFTIGTSPLVAAVAEKLLKLNPVPNLTIDQFSLLGDQVITEFQAALKNRLKLDRLTAEAKGKTLQAADRELESLRTVLAAGVKALSEAKAETNIKLLQEMITEVRARIVEVDRSAAGDRARVMLAEAASARFDTFVTDVTASPKDGGYPPVVRAAMRERLHSANSKHTHVLFVAVEASGGEMITRQSYFAEQGVAVIVGGAQVSYLLLKVEGNQTIAAGSKSLLGHLKYNLKNGEAGIVDRSDFTPHSNGRVSRWISLKQLVKGRRADL